MKTEVRLFLAIALSILILVIYQHYLAPVNVKKSGETITSTGQVNTPTETTENPVHDDTRIVPQPQLRESASYDLWIKEKESISLETNLYKLDVSLLTGSVNGFRIPDYKEHFYIKKNFFNKLLKDSYKDYTKLKGTTPGMNTIKKYKNMIEIMDYATLFSRYHETSGVEKKIYASLYRLKKVKERLNNVNDDKGVELVSVESELGIKPLEIIDKDGNQTQFKYESWQVKKNSFREQNNTGTLMVFLNTLLNSNNEIDVVKKLKSYNDRYYFDLGLVFKNKTEKEIQLGEHFINIGPGIGFIQETGYRRKTSSQFVYMLENRIQRFTENRELTVKPDWVALESQYFACIVIPNFKVKRILFSSKEKENYKQILIGLNTHVLKPGEEKEFKARVYFGPKKLVDLKKLNGKVAKIIDFGFFAIISKPLFDLLNLFHKIFKNYGVAILLLTVIIKIIFYPLNKNQMKSMQRMKEIQPLLEEIKVKYKNDPKKMNQEYWATMKKHNASPLGGCLPVLIQIPVFFALYNILINAIEMRHASFLYIKDLSSADPYYISPILMGVSMLVQQRMTPTAGDPNQQKMMMFMPIIFTVIFLNMPSGLVLYWLASNILQILQQILMTGKKEKYNKKVKKPGGKKWNR